MTTPTIDKPKTEKTPGEGAFNWEAVESQFSKMCQVKDPDCEQEAKWVAHSAHGYTSCPSASIYLCDRHLQEALKWWIEVLKLNPPGTCRRCKCDVVGNVKDHLHAIRL